MKYAPTCRGPLPLTNVDQAALRPADLWRRVAGLQPGDAPASAEGVHGRGCGAWIQLRPMKPLAMLHDPFVQDFAVQGEAVSSLVRCCGCRGAQDQAHLDLRNMEAWTWHSQDV